MGGNFTLQVEPIIPFLPLNSVEYCLLMVARNPGVLCKTSSDFRVIQVGVSSVFGIF
jgi:hypothetical protein